MSIGKRSPNFASLSFPNFSNSISCPRPFAVFPTVSPVRYALSINLGTPLFRLLKGFGTCASATKWDPAAAAAVASGWNGGGESGFAAIIQESMVARSSVCVWCQNFWRQDTRPTETGMRMHAPLSLPHSDTQTRKVPMHL